MARISNEVLATKLDMIHEDVKAVKAECAENTKFRLQAKGIIGAVAFVATTIGAFVVWLADKIWPSKG